MNYPKVVPLLTFSAFCLLTATLANAATIYGGLQQSGAPVAGAQLILTCPGVPTVQTLTDAQGNYHFSLAAQGVCQLIIQVGSQRNSTKVILDVNPNRYDFEWAPTNPAASLQRR